MILRLLREASAVEKDQLDPFLTAPLKLRLSTSQLRLLQLDMSRSVSFLTRLPGRATDLTRCLAALLIYLSCPFSNLMAPLHGTIGVGNLTPGFTSLLIYFMPSFDNFTTGIPSLWCNQQRQPKNN